MCENIEITKEEMRSKRFEDFHNLLDELDDMSLAYIIRYMTKYIDSDKQYVWIMSDDVKTRLLNAMCFPEVIIDDGKISHLLGYPVKCMTFLPIEKNIDSAEDYGEVIVYPYVWLKEYDANTDGELTSIDKKQFIEQSYIRANKKMTIIDFMIRSMSETYRRIFNASLEEVNEYKRKLRAHLRQFL